MDFAAKGRDKIAEVFMGLVAQRPPKKRVTVVDVTTALDIDRKTFYNYFENTEDLSHWIYRDYLRRMLEQPQFAAHDLVFPHQCLQDNYSDWPFYARIEEDDHFLAQELFYKTMAYHFEGNRAYYSKAFQPDSCLDIYDYIISLFLPAIREDVLFMLNGREMPEDAINFITEYHVMGVFGRLRYHFTGTGRFIMQDDINPFWNYAHITMKETIDRMYEERSIGSGKTISGAAKTKYVYTAKLNR
ncbi:MAG: hypothetical protein RR692_05100 [Raoultibacter sp.]